MKSFLEKDAAWIWTINEESGENQYVEFNLESLSDKKVSLFIASDTDYTVWVLQFRCVHSKISKISLYEFKKYTY